MKHPELPSFTYRLFRWFCKDSLFEELEGDLEETFLRNKTSYGLAKARRIYRKEVFKMIRPSVVRRTTSGPIYRAALVANYTTVAFRTLSKNKLFSTINILGLAMSMAIGLLAIAFASEMYSYDQFHEKGDRIFRIVNSLQDEGEIDKYATTSILTAKRLENFGGLERIVPIFNGFNGDVSIHEEIFRLTGLFVGKDFLKVFTFPLLHGDRSTALTDKNTVVLTEKTALRLFDNANAVGEIVERRGVKYTVTGVMENPPITSHMKFDAVASLATIEADSRYSYVVSQWGAMWNSYVYVLLPTNFDLGQISKNLDLLAIEENAKSEDYEIGLALQALGDIFPSQGRYNQMSTVMPEKNVTRIIILAAIVLFSACFNYTNLSLARSLKRAKEVGIRKVVGARRSQLFSQFILESLIIATVSLAVGFLLFLLVKPEFLTLDPYISRTTSLLITPKIALLFAALTVLVGLLAGAIPSLLMTRFKPSTVLKGIHKMKVAKNFSMREVMTGVQFIFSMGFAILVTLAYKQYNFAMNFDLGYKTENVLNVELQGNDPSLLKTAFLEIPEVQQVSESSNILSTGSTTSDFAVLLESKDSITSYSVAVDENYIEAMQHELLAGSDFIPEGGKESIIVNEQFVSEFGWVSPLDAIGKSVHFYNEPRTIVGVVKDFHYGTIFNELKPFAFLTSKSDQSRYLNLKVKSTDLVSTMESLDDAWRSIDEKHEFDATFYDEQIALAYTDLSATMKTFGILASVAISISILGLLGMAVYTAESRIKELTIRKVLGATFSNIVLLLSKSFIRIFTLASLVAIPISYHFFTKTMLENMEYTIEVGFWELASGSIIIIIIALLTISSQTFKAAKTNPATNLRNE